MQTNRFQRAAGKMRDSNESGLKIILEKESPTNRPCIVLCAGIPVGFHGSFPLQKPRMLVRCIRACFKEETKGGCGKRTVPSLVEGRIFCLSAANSPR